MTGQDTGFNLELSRRKLLVAAGVAGAAVAATQRGNAFDRTKAVLAWMG